MAARLLLSAAAAGAVSMYLLDPDHGRRRRAVMRDRLASSMSRLDDARSVASRDLRNRARGVAHEVRSRFTQEEVSDEILCERVRSRLGWAVSHPGAIEVSALSGRVTLSGAVLEREYVRLLRSVWAVRGVADV
ncbi:MAG TPA: BON domain-containing protein, partial [Steroidobacteraceae bacterium]|nr:BON domain-containing protein [Steroidobacteraceae bacterium]